MEFALSEEQREVKRSARAFLDAVAPPSQVRQAMASATGYDAASWRRAAQELGWTALPFAEEHGGLGASFLEVALLLEEMGRALFPSPFFASVCLAGQAIAEAGSEEQKAALLPGIAAGEVVGTLALPGSEGDWGVGATEASFRDEGAGYILSGNLRYVPDGHLAQQILVPARSEGGEEGIFVVPAGAPGVEVSRVLLIDQTRSRATVQLREVEVPASARLAGGSRESLEKTLDKALIGLAMEQLGGAERCLELAVDYAKVRVQFGKPIGSFQAIKHACADMFVEVETTRSAVYAAAWLAATGAPDIAAAASQAKALASDLFFRCAASCVQIHGGIGFTWEHDAHLYLKRAKVSEQMLGTGDHHRERYARLMGL